MALTTEQRESIKHNVEQHLEVLNEVLDTHYNGEVSSEFIAHAQESMEKMIDLQTTLYAVEKYQLKKGATGKTLAKRKYSPNANKVNEVIQNIVTERFQRYVEEVSS